MKLNKFMKPVLKRKREDPEEERPVLIEIQPSVINDDNAILAIGNF